MNPLNRQGIIESQKTKHHEKKEKLSKDIETLHEEKTKLRKCNYSNTPYDTDIVSLFLTLATTYAMTFLFLQLMYM